MKLTLGKKIFGGFGIGVIALVLVSLLAYLGAGKILNTSKDVMQIKEVDRILTQSEVDHLVWGRRLINAIIDPEAKKIDIQFDGHKCNFGKWLHGEGRKEAEKIAPYLAKPLKEMEEPHSKLHESARIANEMVEKGDKKGALAYYLQTSRPLIRELINTFDSMREEVKKHAISDEVLVKETHNHQLTVGVLGVIFGLGLSLVAFFLGRSIITMLKRVISGLNEASEQTASASTQVSSASQSLAEGASEQAAGIQETSSSIEEMASITKKNAESANQANNLMMQTSQVVDEANNAMKELINSMNEISTTSEETAKIIKTIDEIAFQTNLLALNAAVEAARAGEAGAGFAVVADEVRNLAMRAAEAAKNTASLIEESVKKIKNGSQIVSKTNEAFEKVAVSSKKVAELMAEIATASQEQSQGIEQINKAVAEMDKVVQKNAASAEESASAAEEMNAQAEAMKGFVAELVALVGGSNGNGVSANGNIGFRKVGLRKVGEDGNGRRHVGQLVKKGVEKVRGKEVRVSAEVLNKPKPEDIIPMEENTFKEF
jgi:methyl-accepting chemotaxis protein